MRHFHKILSGFVLKFMFIVQFVYFASVQKLRNVSILNAANTIVQKLLTAYATIVTCH